MKNQTTNNNGFSLQGEQQVAPHTPESREIAAAWKWWNNLGPVGRVAAFELGVAVQALRGELPVNTLAGEVKLLRAYKKFNHELGESFEKKPELFAHYYEVRRELLN
jgi:hypothetical protein